VNALGKTALLLTTLGLGAWLLKRRISQPDYSFDGKVTLITGGSRGLGLVLARELTRQGAHVAICARDPEELARAAHDLAAHGNHPLCFPCDITKPEEVHVMVRHIESQLGPMDLLINNAGTISMGPLSTMTRADFEQALAINFWGAYNTVEAVVDGMRQRGQGRIVNISSIGGKISVPHLLPYSVSKFALVGYSQGLRAELANNGIVVTTICPGLMRTGSPRNAQFKGQHEDEYAWFKVGDSLPLLTLSAEEAAREILEACRRGDAEAVLSIPAKVVATANALFPEVMSGLLDFANRCLPRPDGTGTEAHFGRESEPLSVPAFLTAPTDQAAAQNNEIAPTER